MQEPGSTGNGNSTETNAEETGSHGVSRRSVLGTTGALVGTGLLPAGVATAAGSGVDEGIETTQGKSEANYEAAPAYHEYVETEFEIDGATETPKLYGEIIRPADPETGELVEDVPVILTYSPYNDLRSANRQAPGTLGATSYDPTADDPPESKSTADDATAGYFVPRGYARVMVDLVGTRNSGGKYDYGGIRERKTGARLVEFFANEPWTNGRVGMIGGSYDGTTQWAAAVEQPDGLATIVPQVAIDRWYDYAYIEGVRFATFGSPSCSTSGSRSRRRSTPIPRSWRRFSNTPSPATASNTLSSPRSTTCSTTSSGIGGTTIWDWRDYKAKADRIECSAYVEGGWLDDNVKHWDSTRMYNALPADHPEKIVMGQWGHATNQLPDALDVRHAWFDYWLKGLDTGVTDLPQVDTQINTGERYQYRSSEFPPTDTPEVALSLVRSDPGARRTRAAGSDHPDIRGHPGGTR